MIPCPETGFLLCYQQLSLLCTKETRFLIPTVNPYSQKPGFFSAINSYLYYARKKPGFLSPQSTRILRNRVSSLLPTVIFIIHHRNPVSYPHSQPQYPETGFLLCYQQLSLLCTIETRFLIHISKILRCSHATIL